VASTVTVTATYKDLPPNEYAITVETEGGGVANASVNSAKQGTIVTLTATADDGYVFYEWESVTGGATITSNEFTMPANPVTVKSVVSTTLTDAVAKEYGVELIAVLTGFKNIGEQVRILEEKGEQERFIFAYEESYGYLAGTEVRDKDAVVASMLICEMAAFYRSKGISLIQARAAMYEKYGVFYNTVDNFAFEGASGMEKMGKIMQGLRDNYPKEVAGFKVIEFSDYQASEKFNLVTSEKSAIKMPKTNMIFLCLEANGLVIVRPSGTEPKIKVYYTTVGKTFEEACVLQEKIAADIKGLFK